ncbi:GtrA family protein [Fredinandcohnia sp. 179-A 10B2 NHS]|uniref:GtrA family protein n=1 Tax=Fredinandcohnia sp. 179-A 10B2 NHS TaxID=3235176 RepID=UPI0039A084E6
MKKGIYLLIITDSLKPPHSFIRFLLVGLLNTLVGLSCMFLLLHLLGTSYWVATFIGNSIGAAVSYLLNKRFTFASKVALWKSIPLFVVVILSCYVFSYSVSKWIVSGMVLAIGVQAENTNYLAILFGTILYTITNYLGQKHIVFTNKA